MACSTIVENSRLSRLYSRARTATAHCKKTLCSQAVNIGEPKEQMRRRRSFETAIKRLGQLVRNSRSHAASVDLIEVGLGGAVIVDRHSSDQGHGDEVNSMKSNRDYLHSRSTISRRSRRARPLLDPSYRYGLSRGCNKSAIQERHMMTR